MDRRERTSPLSQEAARPSASPPAADQRAPDRPDVATADHARLARFDPEPLVAPLARELWVIAQDPSVMIDGAVLRARVSIPYERLEPGPRGPRFWVVDYDATNHRLVAPGDPGPDAIATYPDARLASEPAVRAQNVYAVAARTLATFEHALGRRLGWGFAGHQLSLVPAAFAEPNAFYDPDSCAILFGFFTPSEPRPQGSGTVYTALSHDIVAHETTHAILDGLRRRFEEPSLPDQAAFHEALADIVALLSVFSLPEAVGLLVSRSAGARTVAARAVTSGALARTALLGLGEEFGRATRVHGGDALRRSVTLAANPELLSDPAYQEPHARGEILVAAVGRALLSIWTRRLRDLHAAGAPLSRDRVADEGAKTAAHLLSMCIRAIDYLPPVDLSFDDFLVALLASDGEVVPDDRHGYRRTLRRAFGGYGISAAPPQRIGALGRKNALSYAAVHADELRLRRDEVFRMLWQNAARLDIPTDYYLSVETVTPCARIAPDGFIVREVVATYIQMLDGPAAALRELAARRGGELALPAGVDEATRLELLGGGTVIFDEFGRLKYHHPKPLLDWARQSRRLAYLAGHGLRDTRGGIGYSQGLPLGLRFAALHAADAATRGETW